MCFNGAVNYPVYSSGSNAMPWTLIGRADFFKFKISRRALCKNMLLSTQNPNMTNFDIKTVLSHGFSLENPIFPKMGHFAKKLTISQKTVAVRANPKTASKST